MLQVDATNELWSTEFMVAEGTASLSGDTTPIVATPDNEIVAFVLHENVGSGPAPKRVCCDLTRIEQPTTTPQPAGTVTSVSDNCLF
jgi:hypothetical protein